MWRMASCVAVAAFTQKFLGTSWYTSLGTGALLYILTGGSKWLRLASKTLTRDFTLVKIMLGIELSIRGWMKKKMVVCDIFDETVSKYPNKKAFVSADTGKHITFKEAQELSLKIANIFYEAGYRKGDAVALLMENRIEYIPIWVGLSRLGVVGSLINFNLRGDSLTHCITVSNCKGVIVSEEMAPSIQEIEDNLDVEVYCFDECEVGIANVKYLQPMFPTTCTSPPEKPDNLTLADELLHIYTSGTTGLPKAAIIRGFRCLYMCGGIGAANSLTPDDVIYNALPLYHSNGGLAVSCNAVRIGTTVIIKKKFSASRYFEECYKYNVTVINYIGETCRYLLAQPPKEHDKDHKIRTATGNGLRASIWKEFQDRFNIPLCVEFYGATEGNANMVNNCGRIGAVGFNSVIFPWIHPIKLIKVDKDTGAIIRGSNGLALEAKPGDVGELVGKVRNDVMHQFDGYLNKESTKKKIGYNIFTKGDSAFLTGDMLIQDEEGFYYFQDRTGDTFRWKGENVSTNEVEGVISKAMELGDVCVYGVEVPGLEGRAGMACMCDPGRQVNLEDLYKAIENSLPAYARPMFIRQTHEIATTGTFKFQKVKLREEGFDPSMCGKEDDLFYFNGKEKKFLSIDSCVYQSILNQEIRF